MLEPVEDRSGAVPVRLSDRDDDISGRSPVDTMLEGNIVGSREGTDKEERRPWVII